MDIKRLELLADIAETHNLTISANNMGYTQSGVSHVIKKLEQELGISLLKRTNRGVVLTDEAKILLPFIHSLTTQYNRFYEAVDSINGLQRGSVTVGTYSSIAIRWLPTIIKNFQRKYPHISLKIREGGLEEIEEWMHAGSVDFGFISQTPEQNFKFIIFAKEPLYAVVPMNFYEMPAFHETFPVTAFADFPFIASESGIDNDVAATLKQADISPPVRFYCKDDHSIIAMVEHGLGITLLPSLILDGYDKNIKKIPLTRPAIRTLGIGFLSSDNLTAAAKAFIDVAKDTILQDKTSPTHF